MKQILLDYYPSASLLIDRDKQIVVDANQKALDMTGWSSDQLIGKPSSEIISEKYISAKDFESIPFKFANGEEVELRVLVQEHRADGRRFLSLSMFKLDHRLLEVMEDSRDGVLVSSMEFKIVDSNSAFSEIIGIPREQLHGRHLAELIEILLAQSETTSIFNELKGLMETGKADPIEVEYQGRNISVVSEVFESKNLIVSIVRDITREKHVLAHAIENEEKYRFLADATVEGIVVYEQGNILDVNESALRMLEISLDEHLNRNLMEFIVHESDRAHLLAKMEEENASFYDIRLRSAKGKEFISEIHTRHLFHKGKRVRIISIRDTTKTYELREQLKKSEERYRTVFQNTGTATCLLASNGTIVLANTKFAELSGYAIKELEGKVKWMRFVHEKDLERMLAYHKQRRISDVGLPKEYQFRFIPRSKDIRHIHLLVDMIPGTDISIASCIDITDNLKAEEELQEREMDLHRAMNIGKMGSWSIDLKTGLAYGSDFTRQLYGFDDHDFINMDEIIQVPLPEYREEMENSLMALIRKNQAYDLEFKIKNRKTGQIRAVRSIAEFNKEQMIVNGVIQDITEKKEAETQIRQQDQYLASVFRAAPAGIGVVLGQNIIQVNDRLCEITGYSKKELLRNGSRILFEDEREYQRVEMAGRDQILESGTGTVETVWRSKEGKTKKILLSTTLLDAEKPDLGITFTALDITQRKKAERDLITKNRELQVSKNKAEESDRLKTAFLSNMSHEIRTPMNGILGFTSLLNNPRLSEEEFKSYIDIIRESGNRLLNTVNDLIDISKIETGQMQIHYHTINVNRLLDANFRFFEPEARKKGIELRYEAPDQAEEINLESDKTKLESILSNLLKNAIKFTDTGYVSMGYKVEGSGNERCVVFCISDTGVGIPKHRQKAVFNRFEQADVEDRMAREGSGLGLAIAKSYAEMLDGYLELESEPGKGSTFYLTIPAEEEPLKVPKEEKDLENDDAIKETEAMQKLKVIIAEDDEASFRHLSILMREYASEILHASNGEEAILLFRQNPDCELILMDVKMPNLNGLTATSRIRTFNQDVYIIAQTAYALAGDKEAALSAGCNDYISKPIHRQTLHKKIEKALKLIRP